MMPHETFDVEVAQCRWPGKIEGVRQDKGTLMRCKTLLLTAPLLLTACGIGQRTGTQVGTEDALRCVELSSEVPSDLEAVPDGFDGSPRALIDAQLGAFTGPQLDDQEQPTSDSASLLVEDPESDVLLLRYEAEVDGGFGDATDDVGAYCPPALIVDLTFTMQADGIPDFSEVLSTRIGPEGETWAQVQDSTGFATALPEPNTFDPSDFDEVYTDVVLSGGYGTWWSYVGWQAYKQAEVESDGDVPITSELLLMAKLSSD